MIGDFPLSEIVSKSIAPESPEQMRLAVAEGRIPLSPAEKLVCLAKLFIDPSPAVREKARESLADMAVDFVATAVADVRVPERVLDLLATLKRGESAVIEALVKHPNVGHATLARLIESDDPATLAFVAQNQRALDEYPQVAKKLLANPALEVEYRSRLASLYGDGELVQEEPTDETTGEGKDIAEFPPELFSEEDDDLDALYEEAETDSTNIYKLIQEMDIIDKIKLATLGGKSARRLLIKDKNKAVSSAVIRSPKIQEDEVLAIAHERTSPDDAILYILNKKEWMKNYQIKVALAQNPKTPVPKAVRLLETLQARELTQISKSKNVPAIIASTAMRIMTRRRGG